MSALPPEFSQALRDGIGALFASERPARIEECASYVVWRMPGDAEWQVEPFVVFANGEVKPEGVDARPYRDGDKAVSDTVTAVASYFLRAADMDLIWRTPPTLETDNGASCRFDEAAREWVSFTNADNIGRKMARARILAVPHGAEVIGPKEYDELCVRAIL